MVHDLVDDHRPAAGGEGESKPQECKIEGTSDVIHFRGSRGQSNALVRTHHSGWLPRGQEESQTLSLRYNTSHHTSNDLPKSWQLSNRNLLIEAGLASVSQLTANG